LRGFSQNPPLLERGGKSQGEGPPQILPLPLGGGGYRWGWEI